MKYFNNYLPFTAYGVFPFLACSAAGLIALYIQFWKGHIPTRVTPPRMDTKTVLLDPIGAIVGSTALLVNCCHHHWDRVCRYCPFEGS